MIKIRSRQNQQKTFIYKLTGTIMIRNLWGWRCLLIFIFLGNLISAYSQQTTNFAQTNYQPSNNYIKSGVFRQEIAKFEINVVREGKSPLPITQVPRVQQGDILKVKLLDEAVGGIKLDQSQWDWTFLVAFINPSHRMVEARDGKVAGDKSETGTVSEEIQFRKTGWYKEYRFTVPYDSQPVFFLYPKPKYRKQLMKVVTSRYEEIRKLGEKTIELAGAYAQIGSFLNELQLVLNRNAQLYGWTYDPNKSINTTNPDTSPYSYSNQYNYGYSYNSPSNANPNALQNEPFGLATIPMLNQIVEGLAKSFNISLPACWGNGASYGGYGGYGSSSTSYNSAYSGSSSYGGYGGYRTGNNSTMDFVSRAQCVAKNVNLQDFDISVSKMWQQGGVFLIAELQKKYPQLAYYINIAAAAIDFIIKAFQKSPLRIVPTVIQSSDNQSNSYGVAGSYQNNYNLAYPSSTYSGTSATPPAPVKISLYADAQPSEGQFVTAYPIVVHKWQANPDPEVISIYPPIMAEPCLHAGQNILKSIDLTNQFTDDNYSRDFRLVMSSSNGFRKEFPLRKNIGLGGWELNITPEDMNQIPKINMALESEIVGTRGFNEIKSPKFNLALSIGGSYEITPESLKNFSVGGRRTITLRNALGSCRCLQRVIYRPLFGGQFVYEAGSVGNGSYNSGHPNNLTYSADDREVSFEIDATNFQAGAGTLEVKTYGGDSQPNQFNQSSAQSANNIQLKLYPAPPIISDIKARRGDREILITGERLDQIQAINMNGSRAVIVKGNATGRSGDGAMVAQNTYGNQYPNPTSNTVQIQGYQTQVQTPIAPSPNLQNAPLQNAPSQTISQYQNLSSNQRIAVFEDTGTRINSETITLELILEDNRHLNYPNRLTVSAARPTIRATDQNEIEGTFLSQSLLNIQNDQVRVTHRPLKPKDKGQRTNDQPQIDLSNYPVVSSSKSAMTIAVQNILTDYSFRHENLSIETRIENATTNPNNLPSVKFDVLDTNNLRLNFTFNQGTDKSLSGRRLQFRIKDRERGDSDWYSIKQTFVRLPQIESVKCTTEMNMNCELKGEDLDYIAQVSIDGGRNWIPQNNTTLKVQPTADGKTMMRIPLLTNQKFLQIKLRDYPNTNGLEVSNFVFSNIVKHPFQK